MENDKIIQLSKSTEGLKQMILENPDLPIIVLTSYEGTSDEWYWTYCKSVSYHIGEYMSYDLFDDEYLVTDREEFEDKLRYKYEDEPGINLLPEAEFDAFIAEKIKAYEPYWVKAIFICADN